jgi:hypothetical protein
MGDLLGMRRAPMVAFAFAAATALFLAAPVHAQWLDFKMAAIPRTSDGKLDAVAPAPRTSDGKSDLSGLWRLNAGIGYALNIVTDLEANELSSEAKTLSRQRSENLWTDDPAVDCLPLGSRYMYPALGQLAKVIQTPTLIIILFEDLTYRQIFLDGRDLPQDPNPSFMGYSVGHWEGDTLVVESTGFNDRPWLDGVGHPRSETMRLTERWRRKNFGEIDLQLTFEDPKFYARSWTVPVGVRFVPDTELLESVCSEHEKSRGRMIGRTERERNLTIPSATLSSYAGRYEAVSAMAGGARVLDVALVEGELLLSFDGKGKTPLVRLTETTFGTKLGFVEFVRGSDGSVTHLMLNANRAVRKR